MNKWIKYLAGILLVCSVAYAADTVFNTDILTFGRPASGNKTLKFRQSNSSSQPGFRFNSATSKMEYSNDGVGYAEFNAEPSMALPFINVAIKSSGWNTGNLTVALTQADGVTDCGVGSAACKIGFSAKKDFTGFPSTEANYIVKEVNAALSYTTGSGTFFGDGGGAVNADYYLYIYMDGSLTGPVWLGISKEIKDEGKVQAVTLDSGGGQNPQALYGPAACAGCVVRLIGRISASTNGGTWNSNGLARVVLAPFDTSIRDVGLPVISNDVFQIVRKPVIVFVQVRCQASPTFTDNYGLVTSVDRIGGGTCRINWKYTFNQSPSCVCVQRNNSGNRFCLTQSVLTSSVQYVLSQDGGGAVDGVDVDMVCIGRGQ
jgi:hypothetical protein